ncbi:MAG: ABC transporter permease [Gemmatimonadota bacterium]
MPSTPWWFAVLLRGLPRSVRERHGAEMRELLFEQLTLARAQGGVAVALTAGRVIRDVVLRIPHEHFRRLKRRHSGDGSMLNSLGFEGRQAGRALLRQPATSLLVIAMLALGIAANMLVFSMINGLFLRPLPFAESERLVYVNETAPKWNLEFTGINFPDFDLWRKNQRAFVGIALYGTDNFNVAYGELSERVEGIWTTHDYFGVLELKPVIGRTFLPEEDKPGGSKVALISYDLWRARYGGSESVLGREIRVNSASHTIIGVLPEEAAFPNDAQLWVPLAADPAQSWQSYFLDGVGRLKPGVTAEDAQKDLLRSHQAIFEQRDQDKTVTPRVLPLREHLVGEFRTIAIVLAGGVAIVLLIACVNVSSVMLARSAARERELGIRRALGAGTGRIARQLLTESALLSVAGAVAGVLLAAWGMQILLGSMPEGTPPWMHFGADLRTVWFAIGVAVFTALIASLAPLVQATRSDANGSLAARASGKSSPTRLQRRTLDSLVAAEIALACVLLVGGGLLLRAYQRIQNVKPGFNPENVLTFRITLPIAKYGDGKDRVLYFDRALESMRAVPGVTHAAAVTCPPLTCHNGNFLEIEGAPPRQEGQQDPVVLFRIATPNYDEAIGLTLKHGRFLNQADQVDRAPGVIVVNETFARTFFGDANPLGKRARMRGRDAPWLTIVGVTNDVKHYGLDQPMRPGIYLPWSQSQPNSMALVIRTGVEPSSIAPGARSALRQIDPELPLYDLRTMNESLRNSMSLRRMYSWLIAVFAGVALALAIGGIYGVLSYVVGQRRREIGIRMALGAHRGRVLRLVLRHGARLAAIGITLGLLAAVAVTRLMATLLFGVPPFDPVTYGAVVGVLTATALIAAYAPARRAVRVNPQTVLRD